MLRKSTRDPALIHYDLMTMGWVAGLSRAGRDPVLTGSPRATRRRRSRQATRRTVPASALPGTELLHIGGGETLPCPDARLLPLSRAAVDAGLGTTRLALPPVRLHVLRDVLVHPQSRVVTTLDGRIVAESITSAMAGRIALDGREMRSEPIGIDGTVAVFRGPLRSTFDTLLADLPRAGLLIHPVVSRLGPVKLIHGGPLTDVEAPLLAHLGSRSVELVEVAPGTPIRAERVVVPGYATRTGVGAVPSWFRRWADAVPLPGAENAPRRIFLADPDNGANPWRSPEVLDLVTGRGVEIVDPTSMDPALLFAVLRDAELVVGTSRDALARCLFSRRGHVVELVDSTTIDPAIYYLAASKGLPYHAVTEQGSTSRHGDPTIDVASLDRFLERRAG